MSAPADLAQELRRLAFDVRNPHRFQDAKRDLADRIAQLGLPNPCGHCPASSLRHSLEAARRSARMERDRADRAESLLASAVRRQRRPRRSAAHALANQLALWPEV